MQFRYKKTIVLILLLGLAAVGYALSAADPAEARVVFLNVGQGDSILVSLPANNQILIDGGPTNDIIDKLSRYIPFYDNEIELVVLTHPHSDHLRGVNAVLARYSVKNIIFSGAKYDSREFEKFIAGLKTEDANIYTARTGDAVSWRGRTILRLLAPAEHLLGREFKKIHESTVVGELALGGLKFLLTGDAEGGLERELVARGLVGDVDVLKVGHHGSKTSSSLGFLNAARPEVAVIEVGKNSYGHPAGEVLERLERLGSKILRTDERGDIVWTFKVH